MTRPAAPATTSVTSDDVAEIALDLMGYVTGWSVAATRLFGFEADEALAST